MYVLPSSAWAHRREVPPPPRAAPNHHGEPSSSAAPSSSAHAPRNTERLPPPPPPLGASTGSHSSAEGASSQRRPPSASQSTREGPTPPPPNFRSAPDGSSPREGSMTSRQSAPPSRQGSAGSSTARGVVAYGLSATPTTSRLSSAIPSLHSNTQQRASQRGNETARIGGSETAPRHLVGSSTDPSLLRPTPSSLSCATAADPSVETPPPRVAAPPPPRGATPTSRAPRPLSGGSAKGTSPLSGGSAPSNERFTTMLPLSPGETPPVTRPSPRFVRGNPATAAAAISASPTGLPSPPASTGRWSQSRDGGLAPVLRGATDAIRLFEGAPLNAEEIREVEHLAAALSRTSAVPAATGAIVAVRSGTAANPQHGGAGGGISTPPPRIGRDDDGHHSQSGGKTPLPNFTATASAIAQLSGALYDSLLPHSSVMTVGDQHVSSVLPPRPIPSLHGFEGRRGEGPSSSSSTTAALQLLTRPMASLVMQTTARRLEKLARHTAAVLRRVLTTSAPPRNSFVVDIALYYGDPQLGGASSSAGLVPVPWHATLDDPFLGSDDDDDDHPSGAGGGTRRHDGDGRHDGRGGLVDSGAESGDRDDDGDDNGVVGRDGTIVVPSRRDPSSNTAAACHRWRQRLFRQCAFANQTPADQRTTAQVARYCAAHAVEETYVRRLGVGGSGGDGQRPQAGGAAIVSSSSSAPTGNADGRLVAFVVTTFIPVCDPWPKPMGLIAVRSIIIWHVDATATALPHDVPSAATGGHRGRGHNDGAAPRLSVATLRKLVRRLRRHRTNNGDDGKSSFYESSLTATAAGESFHRGGPAASIALAEPASSHDGSHQPVDSSQTTMMLAAAYLEGQRAAWVTVTGFLRSAISLIRSLEESDWSNELLDATLSLAAAAPTTEGVAHSPPPPLPASSDAHSARRPQGGVSDEGLWRGWAAGGGGPALGHAASTIAALTEAEHVFLFRCEASPGDSDDDRGGGVRNGAARRTEEVRLIGAAPRPFPGYAPPPAVATRSGGGSGRSAPPLTAAWRAPVSEAGVVGRAVATGEALNLTRRDTAIHQCHPVLGYDLPVRSAIAVPMTFVLSGSSSSGLSAESTKRQQGQEATAIGEPPFDDVVVRVVLLAVNKRPAAAPSNDGDDLLADGAGGGTLTLVKRPFTARDVAAVKTLLQFCAAALRTSWMSMQHHRRLLVPTSIRREAAATAEPPVNHHPENHRRPTPVTTTAAADLRNDSNDEAADRRASGSGGADQPPRLSAIGTAPASSLGTSSSRRSVQLQTTRGSDAMSMMTSERAASSSSSPRGSALDRRLAASLSTSGGSSQRRSLKADATTSRERQARVLGLVATELDRLAVPNHGAAQTTRSPPMVFPDAEVVRDAEADECRLEAEALVRALNARVVEQLRDPVLLTSRFDVHVILTDPNHGLDAGTMAVHRIFMATGLPQRYVARNNHASSQKQAESLTTANNTTTAATSSSDSRRLSTSGNGSSMGDSAATADDDHHEDDDDDEDGGEKVLRFIVSVREWYHNDVPYHNFFHAVDVVQTLFCIMYNTTVSPSSREDSTLRGGRTGASGGASAAATAKARDFKRPLPQTTMTKTGSTDRDDDDDNDDRRGGSADRGSPSSDHPSVVASKPPQAAPTASAAAAADCAGNLLAPVEQLALFIAALCHDIDHQGLNSNHHVKTASPLGLLTMAITGGDHPTAVLEMHHASLTMDLLSLPEINLLSQLSSAEHGWACRVILDAILVTEFGRHGEVKEELRKLMDLGNASSLCGSLLDDVTATVSNPDGEQGLRRQSFRRTPSASQRPNASVAVAPADGAVGGALPPTTAGSHPGDQQGDRMQATPSSTSTLAATATPATVPRPPPPSFPPPWFDRHDTSHRRLVWRLLMQAADISNPTKAFHLARHWGSVVTEEFLGQGDLERAQGLDVHPLNDRSKFVSLPPSQIGFITFAVEPLYSAMAESGLFPGIEKALRQLRRNRREWESLAGSVG